jgi:hypothetical protein
MILLTPMMLGWESLIIFYSLSVVMGRLTTVLRSSMGGFSSLRKG